MKARRILGIVIVIAFLAGLGGWLILKSSRQKAALPASTGDISFAYSGSQRDFEFWSAMVREFEQSSPGIVVSQKYVETPEQYASQLKEQAESHTLPDVALIPLTIFPELAESFQDLRPLVGDQAAASSKIDLRALEPSGIRAFQVNGEQRGLPVMGGNLLIFLNRKAFQKASEFHAKPVALPGSDWTIAEFLRTAEKLTCDFDRDGQTDQYGFALPGWEYYLPFIWSFGADLTDPRGTRWTFSGPTAMAVMRFYRQLATGDRVVPSAGELPKGTAEGAFLSGKVAMFISGPWILPDLEKSELARDYLVAPIPRGPGGRVTAVTWDAVVVRSGLADDRRDRAQRLAAWLLSPGAQRRIAQSGRAFPALLKARDAFVESDPARRKPFVDALSYSRLQAPIPGFEAIHRAMSQHFGQAVDPSLKFEAVTLLEELASDPAIVAAFSPRD